MANQKDIKGEYIICSAIWFQEMELVDEEALRSRGISPYNVDRGIVMCGWRHPNIIYQMVGMTGKRMFEAGKYIQGFLTNKNRFVDRVEGGQIAFDFGQTDELKTYLYSEDIY
jgi:hypothetical protein